MNLYNMMLFLHVSGDIGIFIGIGTWLLSLVALRQAEYVAQVRAVTWLIILARPVSIIGALLTVVTGLYMTLTVWGWQTSWTAVALASLVVFMLPLIRGLVEPRMHTILTLVKELPDGPLPESLKAHIQDPILGTALQTMVTLVFGIVFLMTTKPSLTGSIGVMVVALALGLLSGVLLTRVAHRNGRKTSGSPQTKG